MKSLPFPAFNEDHEIYRFIATPVAAYNGRVLHIQIPPGGFAVFA